LPPDQNGNLVRGESVRLDTSNCILYGENHTIATAGLRDLIVVQKGNQILICHRDYADRLKELLARLQQ